MDPKTIADLALKVLEGLKLSDSQKYELIGRLTNGLMSGMSDPLSPTRDTPGGNKPPAPDAPHEPAATGNVIIPKDSYFVCTRCKEPTLKTIEAVRARMRTDAFREAFSPPLELSNSVWADPNGNAAVDCPSCGARKSVWILGTEGMPYDDVPEGSNTGFNAQ